MRKVEDMKERSVSSARPWKLLTVIAIAAVALGACGVQSSFPGDSFAIVASSDIGVGNARIMVGVAHPDGFRLGSPEDPVAFEIASMEDPANTQTYPARFVWMIEDVVGLYQANVEFSHAGTWLVSVVPESGPNLAQTPFSVLETTSTPNVGDRAPVAPIQTLDNALLASLTTDPNPDEAFYQMTLEEAFHSGRKTVVIFSTPAFCLTAICGPMLDNVKEVRPDHPDVNFVHVEVYTDLQNPDFAPTPEYLAPAVGPDYWNLPSEPWVFVVDEQGLVDARFEGVMDPGELVTYLG